MSAHLLYVITVLIWGSTWFAITLQLDIVHPIWSVAYRFALAAILLIIFCVLTRRRLHFTWQDHGFMALQGVLLFSLNYILFYFAIEHLTSGLVAVVFSTIVFMNIMNGALLFSTPVRGRVVAGASLGLVGITLVFWPELAGFEVSSAGFRSIGLSIVATWVASLGNMAALRNQRRGLPVVESNAFGMAYGAAFTVAAAAIIGAELRFEWSFGYVGSLVYLAVFGSVVAFGCYISLLGRIGADRAAYAGVLFPIVALGVSTLLEGYHWSVPALIGVGMVLAGNLLVLARVSQRVELV